MIGLDVSLTKSLILGESAEIVFNASDFAMNIIYSASPNNTGLILNSYDSEGTLINSVVVGTAISGAISLEPYGKVTATNNGIESMNFGFSALLTLLNTDCC